MVSVEIRRKKDKSVLCRFEVRELPERRLERMALLASRVDKVPELGVALAEIRKLGYELYEWTVEPAKVGWKRNPDRKHLPSLPCLLSGLLRICARCICRNKRKHTHQTYVS